MNVSINTVNVDSVSSGKTSQAVLNDTEYTIKFSRRKSGILHRVELSGQTTISRGDESRGGESKVYAQTVSVTFVAHELQKLFALALKNGVLKFPAEDDLLQARDSIDKAISVYGLQGQQAKLQRDRETVSGTGRAVAATPLAQNAKVPETVVEDWELI